MKSKKLKLRDIAILRLAKPGSADFKFENLGEYLKNNPAEKVSFDETDECWQYFLTALKEKKIGNCMTGPSMAGSRKSESMKYLMKNLDTEP